MIARWSQMALLRAESGWERVIVPAFVYFFAQLYPFRQGQPAAIPHRGRRRPHGCMLVRRDADRRRGPGPDPRRAHRRRGPGCLLKRPPSAARIWLGFSTGVRSLRPYPRLATLWDMIARSAYTQLRYSPSLLAATLAGLLWLYALPPVAAVAGLASVATEGVPPRAGPRRRGWPGGPR
jgi:hypothetical protein